MELGHHPPPCTPQESRLHLERPAVAQLGIHALALGLQGPDLAGDAPQVGLKVRQRGLHALEDVVALLDLQVCRRMSAARVTCLA